MSDNRKGSILLLLTAMIWGTAFVAQSTGMDYVGPLTYVGVRMLLASLVMVPVIFISRALSSRKGRTAGRRTSDVSLSVKGGLICGVFLCLASCAQQAGIVYTTAGKAAFVTALYILFVPVIGVLLGRRVSGLMIICVPLAVSGFYFLCMKEDLSVGKGDIFCLCSAVLFSFQILTVDKYSSKNIDPLVFSCAQYFSAGVIATVIAFAAEAPRLPAILDAGWSIAYTAVFSSCVAYTLQVYAQRLAEPSVASLIMSLESVFAALSGWLILHETMTLREFMGCALVMTSVVISQLPAPNGSGDN